MYKDYQHVQGLPTCTRITNMYKDYQHVQGFSRDIFVPFIAKYVDNLEMVSMATYGGGRWVKRVFIPKRICIGKF